MRWRDLVFVVVLLLIGVWAIPHVKKDLTRAVVPDRLERLFPRLIDRLTRDGEPPPEPCRETDRRMRSRVQIDRLANQDPAAAKDPHEIDHGYGW